MLISAGDNLGGYKILEYKAVVFGTASSAEGSNYRQTALKKACENADLLGANALINMHIEICQIADKTQEATVYGDAVIVKIDSDYGPATGEIHEHKVNLEAYLPKARKSEIARVQEANGYKFVACPRCGTKYKTDVDVNGDVHIKGFHDVDDDEPGLQIFCLRCGTKFTVPGTK